MIDTLLTDIEDRDWTVLDMTISFRSTSVAPWYVIVVVLTTDGDRAEWADGETLDEAVSALAEALFTDV